MRVVNTVILAYFVTVGDCEKQACGDAECCDDFYVFHENSSITKT
jgi:hypothetical protein